MQAAVVSQPAAMQAVSQPAVMSQRAVSTLGALVTQRAAVTQGAVATQAAAAAVVTQDLQGLFLTQHSTWVSTASLMLTLPMPSIITDVPAASATLQPLAQQVLIDVLLYSGAIVTCGTRHCHVFKGGGRS